ncbi:matrilin-2-like isoform X1 [Sabethes cyaneus]|uniref:matrilin-2-like isoform X1 n=1 Tax=Sabethes cyaneus TaxID=53552 RepID=UPI00237DA3A4|nr:matrilin-2-like isoform X1 [Sabethes cyaneus]XP_053694694.1 matrilin-2-like isoform X1 [Sabethes cyaneus]
MPHFPTATPVEPIAQKNNLQQTSTKPAPVADASRLLIQRRCCIRSSTNRPHSSDLSRYRLAVGVTPRLSSNIFFLLTAAAATVVTAFATERKLQTTGRVIFKFFRNEPIQNGVHMAAAVDLKCTHQDEFFYASPTSRCSSYYRCFQRQAIRYKCNDKSVFDFDQQKCTRQEITCYEPICTGKSDGQYADTTQACRRSYHCKGGQLITMDNCPKGHLFDGSQCSPQNKVNCESPTVSAVAIPFSGDQRCYGLQNGNHVIEDEQCKKYMICEDNSVVDVLECPSGYMYNEMTRMCTFSEGIESSGCMSNYMDNEEDICSWLPDGLHLDPTSKTCKSYIKCLGGRTGSRHDCPKSTLFNGSQCVPDFLYHCPRLALPGDICEKKLDGYHVDPRKGCSYFVRCEKQKTVENHSCPTGFQYDPSKNVCVEPLRGEICHGSGYSGDCVQRSAGFYQDFSDASKCAQYFYCFNGNKTTFRCPNGLVFDGENCVSSSKYSCPSASSGSCVNKPNGYYRDPTSGCRSYYYCSEGSKTSYLCNPGQVFSNDHCIDRLGNTFCTEDLVCSDKSDGYYHDLQSHCRNYYYCQRGEKLQTLTCRGSKLFNGNSCVSPDCYTCPHGEAAANPLVNCIPRSCEPTCTKNGFQTDYDSNCEEYFFCIDGKKSVLSCSKNYIFNGEICVPNDTYRCPKYCDATVTCS